MKLGTLIRSEWTQSLTERSEKPFTLWRIYPKSSRFVNKNADHYAIQTTDLAVFFPRNLFMFFSPDVVDSSLSTNWRLSIMRAKCKSAFCSRRREVVFLWGKF